MTSRLKEFIHTNIFCKNYQVLLIVNTLIATFLTIVLFFQGHDNIPVEFTQNFIFSQCIGNSIYLLALISGAEEMQSSWKKSLALTGVFIAGGWIGTTFAFPLTNLIFGAKYSVFSLFALYIYTAVLALIFGSIVQGYFTVKDRLAQTAAQLAQKEINEQRLLRLKVDAELQALRAKLNPHFLFNTLNSIASLIPVEPQKAEEMVQKLASLFHQTLEASSRELVRLADELNMIQQYLEIEKVRLGDRLQYKIYKDDLLDRVMIPGLLLQPLVENSIKYGIAPFEAGGSVTISCSKVDGNCQIEVKDSGSGMEETQRNSGFGLQSVFERLELHYPGNHEFKITNENGVRILIRIPYDQIKRKQD